MLSSTHKLSRNFIDVKKIKKLNGSLSARYSNDKSDRKRQAASKQAVIDESQLKTARTLKTQASSLKLRLPYLATERKVTRWASELYETSEATHNLIAELKSRRHQERMQVIQDRYNPVNEEEAEVELSALDKAMLAANDSDSESEEEQQNAEDIMAQKAMQRDALKFWIRGNLQVLFLAWREHVSPFLHTALVYRKWGVQRRHFLALRQHVQDRKNGLIPASPPESQVSATETFEQKSQDLIDKVGSELWKRMQKKEELAAKFEKKIRDRIENGETKAQRHQKKKQVLEEKEIKKKKDPYGPEFRINMAHYLQARGLNYKQALPEEERIQALKLFESLQVVYSCGGGFFFFFKFFSTLIFFFFVCVCRERMVLYT